MKRACFVLLLLFFLPALAAQASDGFFKAGFGLKPSDADLSDRWLVAFGSDYVIGGQFCLGFELQTAYYSDSDFEPTLHYVPLNLFANVKYKAPFGGARPFVGGGMGLISTFFNAGDSDYVSDFGLPIVGGVELGSEDGKALLLELQGEQNLSADNAPFKIVFFGGLKF